MKPFFSIIIPVYNVEKYLSECINSILQQTFKEYEIIIVDDGSTDSSAKICDEFSEKHSFITVFHQTNGGLSNARNTGLKNATGEYVIFIDSDDFYLDKFFFEQAKLELEKNNYDALFFQRRKFFDSTKELSPQPTPYNEKWKTLNFQKKITSFATNDKLDASAATKITKKSFLISNNLFFKEKIFSEDVEWFFRYAQCLNNFTFLNNPTYGYRIREHSITHSLSSKNVQDLFLSIESYALQIKNSALPQKALLNYMLYQYSIVIGLCGKIKTPITKSILKKCESYKWLCAYAISSKTKKSSFLIKCLGIHISSKILGCYISSKK